MDFGDVPGIVTKFFEEDLEYSIADIPTEESGTLEGIDSEFALSAPRNVACTQAVTNGDAVLPLELGIAFRIACDTLKKGLVELVNQWFYENWIALSTIHSASQRYFTLQMCDF